MNCFIFIGTCKNDVQHCFGSQLLINQLVPASYIQLEDIICNIVQEYHNCQKPPVLTHQEFRYSCRFYTCDRAITYYSSRECYGFLIACNSKKTLQVFVVKTI